MYKVTISLLLYIAFKLINEIINVFIHLIYLIYFYIDAEKPFVGMLNEVYVCMYVCMYVRKHVNSPLGGPAPKKRPMISG